MSIDPRKAFWTKEDADGLRCVVRDSHIDVDTRHALMVTSLFAAAFVGSLFIPSPQDRLTILLFLATVGGVALFLAWLKGRVVTETQLVIDGRGVRIGDTRIPAGRLRLATVTDDGWRRRNLVLELVDPDEQQIIAGSVHSKNELHWLAAQVNIAAGAGFERERDAINAQAKQLSERGGG